MGSWFSVLFLSHLLGFLCPSKRVYEMSWFRFTTYSIIRTLKIWIEVACMLNMGLAEMKIRHPFWDLWSWNPSSDKYRYSIWGRWLFRKNMVLVSKVHRSYSWKMAAIVLSRVRGRNSLLFVTLVCSFSARWSGIFHVYYSIFQNTSIFWNKHENSWRQTTAVVQLLSHSLIQYSSSRNGRWPLRLVGVI